MAFIDDLIFMEVSGNSGCEGKQIYYKIYEKDLAGSDITAIIPSTFFAIFPWGP